MSTLKYFLANAAKHKERVHQFYFIGTFLQDNFKHRFFVKLDSRYGEYLSEHANYFGIPLLPNKSTYGMNNTGNLFDDELTNWMIDEVGFNQ